MDHAELRAPSFQSQGSYEVGDFNIFFAFLTQVTHHLTAIKKNISPGTFLREHRQMSVKQN